MKNTFTLLLLLSAGVVLLFTNCASLTGFQTGRTVGKNKGEMMLSLNYSQTPDFNIDIDQNDTSDIKRLAFPNLELGARYGLTEELDFGLKINTNFNFALDAKYQVLGDKESDVALSVGLGAGTFGMFSLLWNFQVPLYFSYHPNENVDIYITPRYIAQSAAGDISGRLNYFGGNTGVLFGKDVKVGLDLGLYNVNAVKELNGISILTLGIGVKIPLGG
jgi:hypothetical protein